jgi:ribosome-binding factor A
VTGHRVERVAGGIREEVARMLAYELKDPRLGFVTVTRVELTSDLAHARIHVGVLGSEEERQRSLAALRSAAGFVRREVGRRLRMRHAPEIDFRYDKGIDATDRVARLLREAQQASPEQPPPEPQAGEDEGGDGE